MEKFVVHEGLVAPLDRSNIDTDAIIPKQFLTSIKRTGFGQFLFDEWRYLDRGELGMDCTKRPINPDFSLNQPQHAGASILLTRTNFGCGSSREHAAWALAEYGFRVVIAPSFADIYYQNSLKNGILSLALTEEQVEELFQLAAVSPLQLRVDLVAQTVSTLNGSRSYAFDIDPFRKHCLLEGLDDIGLTLAKADEIRAFQKEHWVKYPWLTESLI